VHAWDVPIAHVQVLWICNARVKQGKGYAIRHCIILHTCCEDSHSTSSCGTERLGLSAHGRTIVDVNAATDYFPGNPKIGTGERAINGGGNRTCETVGMLNPYL